MNRHDYRGDVRSFFGGLEGQGFGLGKADPMGAMNAGLVGNIGSGLATYTSAASIGR